MQGYSQNLMDRPVETEPENQKDHRTLTEDRNLSRKHLLLQYLRGILGKKQTEDCCNDLTCASVCFTGLIIQPY